MRNDRRPGLNLGGVEEHEAPTADELASQRPSSNLPVPASPPTKPIKVAPPGVILPDRGLPKYRYKVNVRLGRPDRVPGITSAQQREVWQDDVSQIMNDGTRVVISVANSKSGSKTRTALGLASHIARNSSKFVLVLPATKNTATATLAKMAGITVTPSTLTMRRLAHNLDKFRVYGSLSQYAPRVRPIGQKPGYAVIAEDLSSAVGSGGTYTVELFEELVRTVYPNVDVLILDHGNDDIEATSIGLAAMRMSDVVVMAAREPDPISLETLTDSFRGYQTDVFTGLTARDIASRGLKFMHELGYGDDKVVLPGELTSTRDKLRRATLVMSASKAYDQRSFAKLTWPANQTVDAEHPPSWNGVGVTVPSEKAFAKKGVVVPSDPALLHQATDDAYLELTVAVLRDAVVAQAMAEQAWNGFDTELKRLRSEPKSQEEGSDPPPASPEPAQSWLDHTPHSALHSA